MNRTSRIGPGSVRNDGTVLPGAIMGCLTTWGLPVGGLDPPTSGNIWHPAQESRLNLGPKPSATASTCVNWDKPGSKKNALSPLDSPVENGCPPPGGPPRIPGSTACAPAYWPANIVSVTTHSKVHLSAAKRTLSDTFIGNLSNRRASPLIRAKQTLKLP